MNKIHRADKIPMTAKTADTVIKTFVRGVESAASRTSFRCIAGVNENYAKSLAPGFVTKVVDQPIVGPLIQIALIPGMFDFTFSNSMKLFHAKDADILFQRKLNQLRAENMTLRNLPAIKSMI